jgi:hypothetical protein
MAEHTKESPGCYHSMIKYLADKENTDQYKILRINTHQELYTKTASRKRPMKLICRSYDLKVIDKEGISHPFIIDQLRYDHVKRAIIPDHFLIKLMKDTTDFTTPVKAAGGYTDCLGGGWTQRVSMYKVDDHYFADMDCACG